MLAMIGLFAAIPGVSTATNTTPSLSFRAALCIATVFNLLFCYLFLVFIASSLQDLRRRLSAAMDLLHIIRLADLDLSVKFRTQGILSGNCSIVSSHISESNTIKNGYLRDIKKANSINESFSSSKRASSFASIYSTPKLGTSSKAYKLMEGGAGEHLDQHLDQQLPVLDIVNFGNNLISWNKARMIVQNFGIKILFSLVNGIFLITC